MKQLIILIQIIQLQHNIVSITIYNLLIPMSLISIDLGNKLTTITDGQNHLQMASTILFTKHDIIKIGIDKQTPNAIYDFMRTLGIKFNDQYFGESMKFYGHDFQRSSHNTIEIVIPSYDNMFKRKLPAQGLVALYLKGIILEFQKLYYPKNDLIAGWKFCVIITGGSTHPHRYAIKQVCQILGIQNPMFYCSPHSTIISKYSVQKNTLTTSDKILCLEIGDRITTIAVYKLHPWQQKIIQTLYIQSIQWGGIDFTQILGNHILKLIKLEKGIDIQKYGYFMNILNHQCDRCKISLSQEEQYFLRISNLPDDSTFGKIITQKLLTDLYKEKINQIIQKVSLNLKKYSDLKEIILIGGSTLIPELYYSIKTIKEDLLIERAKSKWTVLGPLYFAKEQITFFDISPSEYSVTGEQNFVHKYLKKGNDIPTRIYLQTKFPSGELQFNLRVFQDQKKVAHFLLKNRPKDLLFKLYFEYNKNHFVQLYVVTKNGQIALVSNYQTLSEGQTLQHKNTINNYTYGMNCYQ